MCIPALLLLLTVGDQLSGILSWLGVPSPFQRSQPSTDQLERTRQQLLKIVKKEVDLRLANSLCNLFKLDLYMEDQRHRVGTPKFELVPEDPPKDTEPSFQAINRVLHRKGNKPPLDLKLTQTIIEVFERQDIAGKLLILGEPGSGKTTELLQLAKDLVTREEQQPVPVILELSSWNGESIDRWVIKQLNKLYSLSEGTTQHWLDTHQILLLLDGLDELGLTKQKQCIGEINKFLETTSTSELVVCCRREEYEAGQIELNGLNGAVYLESLKEDQIRQYFEELNRLSLWENVKGNPTLWELAQKPLFLFMLVVAYQGNPIRNEQDLLGAYIEKQLHDSKNQGTYKPGKEPTPQQTCHYLVWLAKQLENNRETEFLIEGLQPTWLSSSTQIRLYILICGLLGGLKLELTMDPIIGLLNWLSDGLPGGPTGIWLIIGLIIGLASGLGGELGSRTSRAPFAVQPIGKLQWFSPEMIKGLIGGLIFGLMFDWFLLDFLFSDSVRTYREIYKYGLRDKLIYRLNNVPLGGLMGGLTGLMFGLVYEPSDVPITEKETPNQGIRKSIQYGLYGGLMFGLIWELMFRLIGEQMLGLMFGLGLGLFYGLEAAAHHLILRIFLTCNGYTPWNYARFLDHAVKHRFIQRTGGRYRFVHDLLRKHFTAMPLE